MKANFKQMIYVLFLLILGIHLLADAGGYSGNKAILIKNKEITIIHRHNWTQETRACRQRMFWGEQNPFTMKNNYAYIECVKNETHDVLFKIPTPALTYLFIDESSRFIVGLSNIKLDNPVHLILLDNSGRVVFFTSISPDEAKLSTSEFLRFENKFPKDAKKLKAKNLISSKNDTVYLNYRVIPFGKKVSTFLFNFLTPSHFSRNFSESETNFIDWYKMPDPDIQLNYKNGKVSAISLLDPAGERFEIPVNY